MIVFRKATVALLLASALQTHAAPRSWQSADGQRRVQGEFLKRDATSITIRRPDHREVTIPLDQLNPDDRTWVNANHPLAGTEVPATTAVFDQLAFGDTRAQVLAKLKASKFVEMTTDEVFLARVGLNGTFRTRKQIGGLDASLYFDWTENGGLKEVTLQTAGLPANELDARIIPCWKEFIQLLTMLHGKPINASPRLELAPIPDGGMSATHLWKLDQSGTAMLGAARERDQYQVAVRFTRETIQPVVIPAQAPTVRQSPPD